MKFQKMNQNTIKCVLSEQELRDNGLDVYELLNNEDKTRIFMQGVFEAAQREMGDKSGGRFASMEITLLPNKDVELTLSKSSEQDIIRSLEHIKSLADGSIEGVTLERIEEIKCLKGAAQREAYKKLLNDIHDTLEQDEDDVEEFEENDVLECDTDAEGERYNRYYTFHLASMKAVQHFVQIIGDSRMLHVGLYRIGKKEYYMLVDAKGVNFNTVYKFLGTALEFVDEIVPGGNRQDYIREHGTCIIADYAFQILRKIGSAK